MTVVAFDLSGDLGLPFSNRHWRTERAGGEAGGRSILSVSGTLVLALMLSMGVGGLARRYATNFVVFAGWGLIYGAFCRRMMALNINSMTAIATAAAEVRRRITDWIKTGR